MRILLAGALSWHPERLRSLHERGHELWGVWSRSMAWEQGPYPALDGCVRQIALADAGRTIREQRIDCVYSLFQVYDPGLWGPAAPGVEHDVWTLLRALLHDRDRGVFDAPIVRHWGFDVHSLDLDVVRALDGHVFCNREKLASWEAPASQGGCDLDLDCEVVAFRDGDRPMRAFMNDRFAEPLSEGDGEIHTVCVGRPFGIDYLAAAERGIHVHVYGNAVDAVRPVTRRGRSGGAARRHDALLERYVHVHPSAQTIGATWPEVRRVKERWVEEFSRYDAGWSYIGRPFRWHPLDDRAAIPNRVGTYLLAGLPVIVDRRPGLYRYEEVRRLGVEVELVDEDYDDLRVRLEEEVRSRARRLRAREERHVYAFEAGIDELVGVLERACEGYHDRPHADRARFAPSRARGAARLDLAAPSGGRARRAARRVRAGVRTATHRAGRSAEA